MGFGFRGLGFGGLGFRGLGFRVLGSFSKRRVWAGIGVPLKEVRKGV